MSAKLNRYYYTARQIERLDRRLVDLRQRSARWTWARVLSFIGGAAAIVAALFLMGTLAFWIVLVAALLLFGTIVAIHRRLEQSLVRHERWSALKKMQLARMRLDWPHLPNARVRPDFSHPYQGDLDLVGERSVACLIDLSFTESGGVRLRDWLTGVIPPLVEIERRQRLIGELRDKHLLRMQLFVNAEMATSEDSDAPHVGWNSTELEEWVGRLGTTPGWNYWLWIGWALAALNILLLAVDLLLGGPRLWPYSWAIYGVFILAGSALGATGSDRRDVFEDALRLRAPFEQLVALFGRLERYSYLDMPEFKALCEPFLDEEHRPSLYLRRLVRIINATGMRGNPLIWLALNLLAPWDIHFSHALDRCKAEIAHYLPIWLDVWSEIEAANSLANLGYLNPGYVFPVVADTFTMGDGVTRNGMTRNGMTRNGVAAGGEGVDEGVDATSVDGQAAALFEARDLAHPLLPDLGVEEENEGIEAAALADLSNRDLSKPVPVEKVANDFVLDELGEVRLLTGSNMAGKSTFLRTLGVNMALAYAGAPVDASSLHLERFRLFSSIKVTDSVTDGISYFYAEVKRLRLLLDALEEGDDLPVFFFIDEIYRGTNNRERLIGSRAYIRALAGMNGVGLISTHDLDLVTLADDTPQIKNYHFRDEVRNDRMFFDYKLRPGPCPTTNALKIMAMEGLPAGEGDS